MATPVRRGDGNGNVTIEGRIGVLGGTFDPIHGGHLDAAAAARRACALDTVLLVPARAPAHRAAAPRAPAVHRFAMAALAAQACDDLRVSDIELRYEGPSFTSVTLERLAALGHSPEQLFFITGADAFADIASWHDYPAVLDRSHFVVVARPGHSLAALRAQAQLRARMREAAGSAPARGESVSIWLVDAATRDVSSSALRRRISAGEPIDGLVPDAVAQHIARHDLYSAQSPASCLHA